MAKVLVIEDDSTMQRLYEHSFLLAGHEIETASNGEEGLEKVKQNLPDIIFLDIMMPKLNGIELLEMLKKDEETKSIPVVMLTNVSSGTLESAQEAVNNGAERYVIKSDHEPMEMVEIAEEILDKTPVK